MSQGTFQMWKYSNPNRLSQQLSQRWKGWSDWTLSHSPRAVMVGSCFSVEVAERCRKQNWEVLSNPMGTLFHPLIIADWLMQTMQKRPSFCAEWIVKDAGIWKNLKSGAIGNSVDSQEAVEAWNDQVVTQLRESLKHAEVLTITWGTAMAWRYRPLQVRVGNCQKLPQQDFQREWIALEEIVSCYLELIAVIEKHFPQLKVVLTVSPVRHEKMGVMENARSKAILLEAGHRLAERTAIRYFPSYEWITDELRDYEFYDKDGCHPNAAAIDYVCERWINSFGYE